MMKLIFSSLFLIPLLFFNFWYLTQFFLIFIFIMMIFYSCFDFFSNLSYFFGLDYYSYLLVFLTFFICILMILSSLMIYHSKFSYFFLFVCFLIYFFLLLFFFCLNMIYMYIFFEFTLVPLMFLILFWGYQPERLISSLYLFFYTLFGSLPLFLYILYLYIIYDLVYFDMYLFFNYNFFSHLCLVFGFLIKFPMFMLHFWLPKAHVQAPVSGSMVLAGVLLKVGGYGLFRFMFMNESMFFSYSYIWFSVSIFGSLFVSCLCFLQFDMKCLVAYSSVCHMGLCLLGFLTMTSVGILGSFLMMMSHGFCSSGLFFLCNLVYDRMKSRSFFLSKGMIFFMPSMSLFWFLFCCFNMGCPPSLGFFSEVFIFISCLCYWSLSYFYLFFISFFSACFSFFLYSYIQHGLFSSFYSFSVVFVREYLIIFIHLYPLIFLDFFLSSL